MNYEKDGDLRCGSSAVKTVKGFTLIELIIVIAILGILASISSLAIAGFVRDSRIESINSKAQQAYSSLQNMMIDMEIKDNRNAIDYSYLSSGTASSGTNIPVFASIEFFMDNSEIDKSSIKVVNYKADSTKNEILYSNGNATAVATAYKYLQKTIKDTIAAGFTGYVYADINIQDYTVESVVFSETPNEVKNAVSASGFVDLYKSTSPSTAKNVIHGTKNLIIQKDELKKTGKSLGYYPFMEDISAKLEQDKSPSMPS